MGTTVLLNWLILHLSQRHPLTHVARLWPLNLKPGLGGQCRLAGHGAASGHDLLGFGSWRHPGRTERLLTILGHQGCSSLGIHDWVLLVREADIGAATFTLMLLFRAWWELAAGGELGHPRDAALHNFNCGLPIPVGWRPGVREDVQRPGLEETAGPNTGQFSWNQLSVVSCVDAADCQVQGGVVVLSQVVKTGPWIVVWLQIHGRDVTCLTLESKRRVRVND